MGTKKHTDGRRKVRARLEASPAIRWIEQIGPVRVPDKSLICFHMEPRPNRHERRATAARKRKADRAEAKARALAATKTGEMTDAIVATTGWTCDSPRLAELLGSLVPA